MDDLFAVAGIDTPRSEPPERRSTPRRSPSPFARKTDPETSKRAVSIANLTKDRAAVLKAHSGFASDGLTDFELADLLGKQQTSVGKRRGELCAVNLIRATKLRRPAPSGSLAIVWQITPVGMQRAAEIVS